ncbi:Proteasome subunit alpha type-1 [Hondaea fermentalgiana]|uniref:Proteasome subunit alpha type n=1 Tax=Hondaea fermentalgiana TaxID=2315210 RepID=A0A2R5GCI8_9STRA|nr:Proteasome subunit alpha type-1 [Hondaea fermentalgiana]|eukprot:GBG28682.1 Proteasome subunit alpha type-1 [Hondaea fermentalgiana]
MNRNQYDTDVSTWSPQGKLHQVEYAMESKKLFKVDDHIGIGVAGLTADARSLATYMRTECLNHRFQFNSPIITGRLVSDLADKHQARTQASWKRPYGVGLLVGGFDRDGPHLYQTCPSGNLYEYKAMAIGSRAQSAKTYMEKHLASIESADLETLVIHALKALEGPANDKDVSMENASVSVLGKGQPFQILEGDDLKPFLDQMGR